MPFLPRSFLPEFNEGNIYVIMLLSPDTSLTKSYQISHLAEQLVMQMLELKSIGRPAGRSEMDTEGDPVNDNEMVMTVKLDHGRSREQVMDDIRNRLSVFSANDFSLTQQLAERIEQEDIGVNGAIVVKIYGDVLRRLQTLAEAIQSRLNRIRGLVDILVAQQYKTP